LHARLATDTLPRVHSWAPSHSALRPFIGGSEAGVGAIEKRGSGMLTRFLFRRKNWIAMTNSRFHKGVLFWSADAYIYYNKASLFLQAAQKCVSFLCELLVCQLDTSIQAAAEQKDGKNEMSSLYGNIKLQFVVNSLRHGIKLWNIVRFEWYSYFAKQRFRFKIVWL